MNMRIPPPIRSAIEYAVATVVPVATAILMPNVPAISPFFLWAALSARFFGFGPAVVCTFSSVASLWLFAMSKEAYSIHVQGMRLGLFFIASLVVSSLSRQRSKEAREAEERYRSLVELAPDGIVVTDESGTIVFANSALARIVGADDAAGVIGHNALEFVHPDDQQVARTRIDQVVSGQQTPWVTATAVRLDGTFVQVERAGIPLIRGDKVFAQGFVRDVTERLASEARSREAQRAIQHLSARLLRAQEAEQRRLAKQLHDTTAQDLVAIRLNLAGIHRSSAITDPRLKEVLKESMELTEQVISGIRTLSYLLHPPLIEEAGLASALKWYAAGFEARSGIKVDMTIPEDLHIPHEIETALFRVIQEALTNIQRHSGSGVARIGIEGSSDSLRLRIADEGRGIPLHLRDHPEALFASGVGMAGIRERVEDLGGELQVESSDRGTNIVVTLPNPQGDGAL
jgi:PAS domain S-box-containing protein